MTRDTTLSLNFSSLHPKIFEYWGSLDFIQGISKQFQRGTIAKVTKTTVLYNPEKQTAIIKLYYCVVNPDGVLQWPQNREENIMDALYLCKYLGR